MNIRVIESVLRRSIGLNVESIGTRSLVRAVEERMAACAVDETSYARLLSADAGELQRLIETVVVNETWFFRDVRAFEALLRFIRSERPAPRPIRILSFPCATGEEPYSIAMALIEGGVEGSRIAIDAMDVSSRALEIARAGCYGQGSFRGAQLAFRDRFFRSQGSRYCIHDEVKSCVRFTQGNLLELAAGLPYDAIFCRNVLIYFDTLSQQDVLARLERLLADHGLLWVGVAEAHLTSSGALTPTGRAMAFAFRKGAEARCATEPRAPLPKKKRAPLRALPKKEPARQAAVSEQPPAAPSLDSALRLADQGRLAEAKTICETHLAQFGPSAAALYVLALVCDAMGDRDRAATCYGQVSYLDPEHDQALIHLALIAESRGDRAAAARYRERARRVEERRQS